MEEIKLDNRLLTVAGMVRPGDVVADIGCDHGYLAGYLVLQGLASRVYAADVNPQPLEKARQTIERYRLEGAVIPVLSDGLAQIPKKVDTVVMAGMGGELIASLLEPAVWFRQKGKRLILQPMTFAEKLRRWLCENGFSILEEEPVLDGKHTYCILCAEYTGEAREPEEWETVIGMITMKQGQGPGYLSRLLKKYQRMYDGLSQAQTYQKKRLGEITIVLEKIRERMEESV